MLKYLPDIVIWGEVPHKSLPNIMDQRHLQTFPLVHSLASQGHGQHGHPTGVIRNRLHIFLLKVHEPPSSLDMLHQSTQSSKLHNTILMHEKRIQQ